jgi:hypothetical protein
MDLCFLRQQRQRRDNICSISITIKFVSCDYKHQNKKIHTCLICRYSFYLLFLPNFKINLMLSAFNQLKVPTRGRPVYRQCSACALFHRCIAVQGDATGGNPSQNKGRYSQKILAFCQGKRHVGNSARRRHFAGRAGGGTGHCGGCFEIHE